MNQELINKIAQECEDYVYGEYIFNRDKFAEMIVQECAKMIQKQKTRVQANAEYKRGYTDASDDAVGIIKAHFGVEQ